MCKMLRSDMAHAASVYDDTASDCLSNGYVWDGPDPIMLSFGYANLHADGSVSVWNGVGYDVIWTAPRSSDTYARLADAGLLPVCLL